MNLDLAKLCVQASADAYAPLVSEQSIVRDLATDTLITIVERVDENCILIACRGTKSPRNFITDAEAWKSKVELFDSAMEVHCGFLRAVESIVNPVLAKIAAVNQFRATPLPVILTGHSLGGAIAVLLGIYIDTDAEKNHAIGNVQAIYTFGQPRIGNKLFAAKCQAHFNERHIRFDDAADVVPCVPGLLAGYRHSGVWEFLTGGTMMLTNPSRLVKVATAAFKIWGAKSNGPLAIETLLADHHVARYQEKVNALT